MKMREISTIVFDFSEQIGSVFACVDPRRLASCSSVHDPEVGIKVQKDSFTNTWLELPLTKAQLSMWVPLIPYHQ